LRQLVVHGDQSYAEVGGFVVKPTRRGIPREDGAAGQGIADARDAHAIVTKDGAEEEEAVADICKGPVVNVGKGIQGELAAQPPTPRGSRSTKRKLGSRIWPVSWLTILSALIPPLQMKNPMS
jgi:hypothetical protein